MPKMKSHSSSKKRFGLTAKGKVKRTKAFRRHLMASKTAKRKRQLRGVAYIAGVDAHRFKRLLPYQ